MDGGMLEEAAGAKLICNHVLQHFWNGNVFIYQNQYDKINPNQTEPFKNVAPDVVETLILQETVMQEPMLMVGLWIHMPRMMNVVFATVVDVAPTMLTNVTHALISMAIICERDKSSPLILPSTKYCINALKYY
jgi:hypothetical protein